MDTVLDQYGQPFNVAFNAKRNVAKALENLLGIVQGMNSDGFLTDGEVVFLHNWLVDQKFIRNDPDVVDLLDALDSILDDGVITTSEKEDLQGLLSDFLEYRDEFDYVSVNLQDSLKRCIGVFAGISADNKLSDSEVLFLKSFIESLDGAKHHWPVSSIYRVVMDALDDGFVSGAERSLILANLHDAVGGSFTSDGVASGKTTSLPFDVVEYLDFESKVFCLTGTMSWGTRKECVNRIQELGGSVSSGVSKKVDYLILGKVASRDWFNTSYGRKIEKAVKYRDELNTGILLVSESDWIRFAT